MSTNAAEAAIQSATERSVADECDQAAAAPTSDTLIKHKSNRKVSFPAEDHKLVTEYFEPANPWQDAVSITREQLAEEYLCACRRHESPPSDCVLQQIRELPAHCVGGGGGGGARAPQLVLAADALRDARAADCVEAVLRRVQFLRLTVERAALRDEAAEAIFDMIEYYESCCALCVSAPLELGLRGWQALARLIKKSAELVEVSLAECEVPQWHAPVLSRALASPACRLRALSVSRATRAPHSASLLKALKSNMSIRELRLCDDALDGADAAELALLLRCNRRIHTLDLSNNRIEDAGVAHLAAALEHQAAQSPPPPASPGDACGEEGYGLAFLVLWNNQLTAACAHHLVRALQVSATLRVLNVGANALGGEFVATLAAASPPPRLASLGLQAAALRSAAPRLAALIRAWPLQRLDLRENALDAAALQTVLEAVRENATLTQIDLDDAEPESSLSPAANRHQLQQAILAACRRNAPAAAPPRKHSLTCSARRVSTPEEQRPSGRLKSPLPSPAGSPVPGAQAHSRFSVTRVTPEREAAPRSSPSRFKVMQVSEPPRIFVQNTDTPKTSRFSVTRNYDSEYDSQPPKAAAVCGGPKPDVPVSMCVGPKPDVPAYVAPKPEASACGRPKPEASMCVGPKPEASACGRPKPEASMCVAPKPEATACGRPKPEASMCVGPKPDVSVCVGPKEASGAAEQTANSAQCASDVTVIKSDVEKPPANNATPVKDANIEVSEIVEATKQCINVNISTKASVDQIGDGRCGEAKDVVAFKQIAAITEDLGNLIEEMRTLTTKTCQLKRHNSETVAKCRTVDVNVNIAECRDDTVPVSSLADSLVLKKIRSESNLDSPDSEVDRFMSVKVSNSPFCDSSSSLEVSGSSMESLNTLDNNGQGRSAEGKQELDRRKDASYLSTGSSTESTDTQIASSNLLNTSISSTDSVSPITFDGSKKTHGSLSSLEASVSSLDSAKGPERVMMTSADSGIEHSIQNRPERKGVSSNEGTLTSTSSLRDAIRSPETEASGVQETLTSSPKRTSSMLDVPGLKNLERMRKISWVAPSPGFHVPRPEPERQESKLPIHLEKLLSLFQNPGSIFSRSEEDKKASAPPRKDSATSSSFWTWGGVEREKEGRDASEREREEPTLTERVQITFVDETFSKQLDSKSPSTESTLSEPAPHTVTTEHNLLVQNVDLSLTRDDENSARGVCDRSDLSNPNDILAQPTSDVENLAKTDAVRGTDREARTDRPRSFAAVLKSSATENTQEKQQCSPGQSVENLPSKVIRGIKENISPENTLTSSMTNTKTLITELNEREPPKQTQVCEDSITKSDGNANAAEVAREMVGESMPPPPPTAKELENPKELEKPSEAVDLAKDALSYLVYQDFDPSSETLQTEPQTEPQGTALAQELKDAELKEQTSPSLVQDDDVFDATPKPKVKANSLEDLSQREQSQTPSPNTKSRSIMFNIPETGTVPRDIPRAKLRTRSGSSPKSLPDSIGRQPFARLESHSSFKKKKKTVSSLGKIAKDSLLALNRSEDEITEIRRSYKLTSLESLKSLESVSEDANSHSGNSAESKCRACFRMSQESLMSLDSITEDCRCDLESDKGDSAG